MRGIGEQDERAGDDGPDHLGDGDAEADQQHDRQRAPVAARHRRPAPVRVPVRRVPALRSGRLCGHRTPVMSAGRPGGCGRAVAGCPAVLLFLLLGRGGLAGRQQLVRRVDHHRPAAADPDLAAQPDLDARPQARDVRAAVEHRGQLAGRVLDVAGQHRVVLDRPDLDGVHPALDGRPARPRQRANRRDAAPWRRPLVTAAVGRRATASGSGCRLCLIGSRLRGLG